MTDITVFDDGVTACYVCLSGPVRKRLLKTRKPKERSI